jgi:hypothetical protein
MATTVLYRKSSGEVLKISLKGQKFDSINSDYFGYLTDPEFPDGTDNREVVGSTLGPSRQLGFQKIAIIGDSTSLNIVRNATQEEIDSFPSFELDDANKLDAAGALAFIDNHPRFRKVFAAILKLLVQQLLEKSNVKQNAMIDQWNQFKTDIGNATSLADIKTSVAALPTITSNLPETATLSTIRDQLDALINKDD